MIRPIMLARVKHLLFAANVVALVAVATVYALSYLVGYTMFVYTPGRCTMVDTLRGEISIWTGPVQSNKRAVEQRAYAAGAGYTVEQIFARHGDENDYLPRTLGFGYGHTNIIFSGPAVSRGGKVYLLVTPYWFLLLILSIAPARRLARRWHQARLRRPKREAFPVFASPRV